MAFCGNCGANLADGATVCPSCGRPVAGTAPGGMTFAGAAGGTSAPMSAPTELATWGTRFYGIFIDFLLLLPLSILSAVFSGGLHWLFYFLDLAGWIWFSVQVGQSGQSPGMRVAGLRCVGQSSGQPIGGGMGFVRYICHIIDTIICLVGWFFPLWDKNRQTIADKIVSTVVVVVPKSKFSLTP